MLPFPEKLPDMELRVFNSGWVTATRDMMLAGARRERIRVPAMFAMLRHPQRGIVLYDTGYSTRFFEATSRFPYSILRKFTPVEITEEDNAVRQLDGKLGIGAGDVKTILLGHGHVDHVPGALDFPNAEVIVDHREWAFMQGPTYKIFFKGYIKSLYDGIAGRVKTIDFAAQGKPYGPFEYALDLWEDGSTILVPLEGHTVGQMGLLVNLPDGRRFLFIGDAAWLSENYLELKPPSILTRTILASFEKFKQTLHFLESFHKDYPDVTIVPCHCPRVWEELKSSGVAM